MNWADIRHALLGGAKLSPGAAVPRLSIVEQILEAEREAMWGVSVMVKETWQVMQILRDHAPELFRGNTWYSANTNNWVPPPIQGRTMSINAGTFDQIAQRAPDSWPKFVDALVRQKLPDIDISRVTFVIEEAPGANRPLQKYLFVKPDGAEKTLVKGFRYFAELDNDDAMMAKIMLLVG